MNQSSNRSTSDIFQKDQYQASIDHNSYLSSPIAKNNPIQFYFSPNIIEHQQIQNQKLKLNISARKSKSKNTQRYLKIDKSKRKQRTFNKTQDQNFQFNSVLTSKGKNMEISTQAIVIQRHKKRNDPYFASRYAMYSQKPKNFFYFTEQKKDKKSKNFETKQSLVVEHEKELTVDMVQLQNQKKISQHSTKNNPVLSQKNVKNFSFMLDRRKIDETKNRIMLQKKHKNSTIIERNKLVINKSVNKQKIDQIAECYRHQQLKFKNSKIFLNKRFVTSSNYNSNRQESQSEKKIFLKSAQGFTSQYQNKNFKNQVDQNDYQSSTIRKNQKRILVICKQPQKSQTQNLIRSKKGSKTNLEIVSSSTVIKNDLVSTSNLSNKVVKKSSKKDLNQIFFPFQQKTKEQFQIQQFVVGLQTKKYLDQKPQQRLILMRPKTSKQVRLNTQQTLIHARKSRKISVKSKDPSFVFDSKDHQYISQYLKLQKWRLIPNKVSIDSWTLKWVTNPIPSQIMNLKQGQFYNHFHKSYELTSKNFLNANLKSNRHNLKTQQFFPQTFDIGNQAQSQEFLECFRFNTMMKILQKTMKYCFQVFSSSNSNFIKDKIDQYLSKDDIQQLLQDKSWQLILQNQSFNSMQFENYRQNNQDFKINIFLTTLALKFYRKERKRYEIDFKQKNNHFLKFKQSELFSNFSVLEEYSQQEEINVSSPNKGQFLSKTGLFDYNYATPSNLLLNLCVKQYVFFSKVLKWKYPLWQKNYNISNIWIVKPSSNSRGNGIYLETNCDLMLKSAKDIQSRIVQKYINDPLLLKNTAYSYLNQHKFDIRQWVLLKSLDPLQIYMFSHFYIRLASQNYQLYPIDNNKVHLTNFSANKEHFKENDHSVINCDQFIRLISEEYSVDWEKDLKPKIVQIIIKSIKCCQQKLEMPQNGKCFELLGYDILIDQKFNPWLIQVNMSPACEQRTPWLAEYLKNMNEQIVEIVLDQGSLVNQNNVERKQFWQKICHQQYFFNSKDYDPKLEVTGVNTQQSKIEKGKNSKPQQG